MKSLFRVPNQMKLLLTAALMLSASQVFAESTPPRVLLSADDNWKFVLGDPAGADSITFDDQHWRTVSVPHDWSIEAPPDVKNTTGSGGGYYPAGVGWYRKSFTGNANWKNKRVSLEFDGVAGDTTVYLNGKQLGIHPYAYTSFRFDITSQVDVSKTNVIAVRVDNAEQPASRWYSGSGIYRHVHVVITEPIHVSPWGTFVSTPEASASSARVLISTMVSNDDTEASEVSINTIVRNSAGSKCGEATTRISTQPGQSTEVAQAVTISQPSLWSPVSPHLYRAITRIMRGGKIIDEVETPFGVRSLAWSVEKGLLLNGTSIKLAGGSVHQDNGPLGAAAYDRAEERKVQLLKAAGFNAVRTAHNPPSPAFLDACDRLGLLVLDEPFDVWTVSKRKYDYARFFHDWWQQDIDSMVKRDRNHPSIILWGIGNEIPEVWTPDGATLAKEIAT